MRANIPIDLYPVNNLLEDWAWLVRKPYRLIAMNNFGDLFLKDDDGKVDFLQLEAGEIIAIADSVEEFQKMAMHREKQREWFFTDLLTELEVAGMALGEGQCFALKKPIVLGGIVGLENMEISSIVVHVSMLGQIHEQVRNLPGGTKISSIKIG